MPPTDRINLDDLWKNLHYFAMDMRRITRQLRVVDELANFPNLQAPLEACVDVANVMTTALLRARDAVDHARQIDQTQCRGKADALSENDIEKLLMLNRHLTSITKYLQTLDADLKPCLEARLADQNDPVNDSGIVARIEYVLREDDPEFDESDDNLLTVREENLECSAMFDPDDDWGEHLSGQASAVNGTPHCWLFHDLYDHSYGRTNSRAMSLRECLRIGKIFIDVEVQLQYCFDMENGAWVKHWPADKSSDFKD